MPREPVSMAAAIGQQVAEQIVGDDHIELLGLSNELHGAVVGIHVR